MCLLLQNISYNCVDATTLAILQKKIVPQTKQNIIGVRIWCWCKTCNFCKAREIFCCVCLFVCLCKGGFVPLLLLIVVVVVAFFCLCL